VDSELGAGTTFSFSLKTVDVEHVAEITFDELPQIAETALVRMH
jgi:hypothetical protein